ncbi:predicted protein [Lichtheimia corymbifera JMRC:FSU:9682]|uniref:Mediator of RNA polymerase II transcription subunit 4 n=1 Tax=Lichtheimia corymbifera JMRC:FSU:9682 TaxID=1263082 RepID=A0A068RHW6_9FUNG|nr:predicted protein [Lichtheimia corymbifera JMRC:FSU:9682]
METSLRDRVDSLLTEYSQLTRQFFQSLTAIAENTSTTTDPLQQAPDQLVKRITDVDARLQSALEEIEQHQTRQQRIIAVQDEIQQHQAALLSLVERLNDARETLDKELTQASKEQKSIQFADKTNVDFSDILSYASKLSKYTSAPPGFDQMSNDFKVDFEKPYPDEDRMRRGLLYRQYAGTHVLPNITDETVEHLSMASSEDEERRGSAGAADGAPGNKPATEEAQDNFWILDLNPDLPS